MERHASCHCGQLVLLCAGEPLKISLCHCFDCQRRTGSLFSVAAFFARTSIVPVAGAARRFDRPSVSGFGVSFHFCPECGSSLWWEPERLPQLIGVAAGAFADPGFPMPEQAVWTDEAHRWLELPPEIAAHARSPVRTAPGE